MKIAVFGTGAIGGYIGGRLARAGHDVSFIARGAHLDAIRANGLTLREVTNDDILDEFVVRAPATDTPADIGPVDFVLLGVKAYDTDSAATQAAPLMGDHSAIVTIQNGLDAPERLANHFGAERVIAGTTTYTATIVAPGIIHRFPPARHVAVAESTGPASPRLRAFVEALNGAEIQGELSEDPMGILWEKFTWIGPVAAITAV